VLLAILYFILATKQMLWYTVSRMKHKRDNVRTGNMEAGTHIANIEQLAGLDGWEGYEYWSAQLEAEGELLSGLNASTCEQHWVPPQDAYQEGRSDVLPF
jgi:hypothetical protein